MPEVVKTHAYQFLLYKLQRTFEGKSPPSRNEVYHALIFPLFDFDQFWQADTSLGVTELPKELVFYCLLADN